MHALGCRGFGQLLGAGEIADADEGLVGRGMPVRSGELSGKLAMAVATKLEFGRTLDGAWVSKPGCPTKLGAQNVVQ